MKASLLTIVSVHLFFSVCFSQTNRKTVIENKIKAITEIVYDEPGDKKKKETKTYYTIKGDDSVKIINGQEFYIFRTTLDKETELSLEPEYKGKNIGEVHYYKYEDDSSYSIEIVEIDSEASRYYKYNSKHDCLFVVLKNGDTVFNQYNSAEKLEGMSQMSKRNSLDFEMVEFDKSGNVIRLNYKIDGIVAGFSTYKYNDKGLQEEVKQFAIVRESEKYMTKTVFVYEFWE